MAGEIKCPDCSFKGHADELKFNPDDNTYHCPECGCEVELTVNKQPTREHTEKSDHQKGQLPLSL